MMDDINAWSVHSVRTLLKWDKAKIIITVTIDEVNDVKRHVSIKIKKTREPTLVLPSYKNVIYNILYV